MTEMIRWMAAEAERPGSAASAGFPRRTRHMEEQSSEPLSLQVSTHEVRDHQLAGKEAETTQETLEMNSFWQRQRAAEDQERERRIYRGRTVAMLRRYMRYSICLLYTSPSPRDRTRSRMPSSA